MNKPYAPLQAVRAYDEAISRAMKEFEEAKARATTRKTLEEALAREAIQKAKSKAVKIWREAQARKASKEAEARKTLEEARRAYADDFRQGEKRINNETKITAPPVVEPPRRRKPKFAPGSPQEYLDRSVWSKRHRR